MKSRFTLKKMITWFFGTLAFIIMLTYAFGYDYIFTGARLTYMKGETSSNINDGVDFKYNVISKGVAKAWEKDSLYNRKKLSANLIQDLKQSQSASFLVIKNGKLLHEEYFDTYSDSQKTNSFSMAKTFTVMLLGKAIEDKKILDENELLSQFYPQFSQVEKGKNLTLRDLAAMEAGIQWSEDYKNPFLKTAKLYYGKYMNEVMLLRPEFESIPGERFEYQSGATQLLGYAVRKAVNIPLSKYASDKFWKPLGMENDAFWTTDENHMEKTFCCIHSVPRDFAKLGQLMLNNGNWNGTQLLNANFIEKMKTPGKLSGNTYGLGLWTNYEHKMKHYYFWGLQGQYIIIIPEKQMIIVRTGSYKDQPKDSKGRPVQVGFLVDETAKLFN